jgi:two-component system, cell cycle sensor histidine kinase and response regulator CckA
MPLDLGEGRSGASGVESPQQLALDDVVRDPIIATNDDRRIVFWNRAAHATYGFDRVEAVGMRTAELLRSTLPIPLLEIEERVRDTGFWEGHVVHRTKDDRELTVESRWVVRLDDDGRHAGILEIDRDVTADLESAETRKDEDLDRDRLQLQVDRSEHLDSVGQLAGGIAHDFNNSLGVIINYAGFVTRELRTLEGGVADPKRWESMRQDVGEIEIAALRAARLIHQLLAFARREVSKPVALNVNDLIGSISELLRSTVGENVAIGLLLQPGLPAIYADPGQLEQVLVNVASNGRDAMPTGGNLTIATSTRVADLAFTATRPGLEPGTYVELRVSDTGQGMSPDVLARVFEPFFTTKPSGRGTGLGLASVKGIVARLEGHAEFSSELGSGTTFRSWIPVTDRVPAPVGPRPDAAPSGGSETILVVEDEGVVRAALQRILARAGYRVISAPSGLEALAVAAAHPGAIDLLLADVVMPEMPGNRLSDELKGTRPEVRTLYMSGFAEPFLGQSIGADIELIEKPFTEEALLAHIRRALS